MKLPPMNALRAFETVSRLGSVSKAADELCVSQGAISQQLRKLEDHLGCELFDRTPNSIALSESGETFAAVVQRALNDIAMAADNINAARGQRNLTVSMGSGIALRWLMPKLRDFYQRNPDITVVLDQSVRLVSFKNDGIDAAIRFGNGEFDDLDSLFLFLPQLCAVASPDYLAAHGELESLADPGDHHLIDYQYRSKEIRAQHVHWEDVVAEKRVDSDALLSIFPDEHQAFNEALQGRGIALVPNYLMEDELASGEVVIACPEPIPSRFSYYFVWPADARPNPDLDSFREWLYERLAKYREE